MDTVRFDDIIKKHGEEILNSEGIKPLKQFLHHGKTTTFNHSINVARVSLSIAERCRLKVDERALVRGALLHDYYLYDWHEAKSHLFHGFTHAKKAAENAMRDFHLGLIELDIIKKHMFPLNLSLPRYKESFIVGIADKICAVCEKFSFKRLKHKLNFGDETAGY